MRRTLAFLIIIGSIGTIGFGCSSPQSRSETIVLDPIRADSPQAQADFEQAVRLLETKQWDEARQAFLTLQSDYPNDPIALVAELYVARATLKDFKVDPNSLRSALSVFSGLANDSSVDGRVRFAAIIYQATAQILLGQRDAGLKFLGENASPSMSPNVLFADRQDAWALLIEALIMQGRFEHSMIAMDNALNDSAELRPFVLARAFEVVNQVPSDIIESWTTSKSPLLRGLSSYRLAYEMSRSDSDPDALSELVKRGVADLRSLGEDQHASQLAQLRPTVKPAGPLRIGVLLPQSGPNAAVGKRAMRGAFLARDAFGSHVPDGVTLVMEDSADLDGAMKRLKEANVAAIVGPIDSNQSKALAASARSMQIPVLSITNEITSQPESWVFRNFLDAEAEARVMARIARTRLGHDSVHIIYPDIGYGRRMANAFRSEFERLGGQAAAFDTYDRNSKDFSQLATRVAKQDPRAIYIPDSGSKVAEISAFLAAQNVWGQTHDAAPIRDNRIRVHYLGTSLWQDSTLEKQASSYLQGAIFPVWISPTLTQNKSQSFVQAYRTHWNSDPGDLEAFTYDSVSMIVEAYEELGAYTPRQIRELLTDSTPYLGATGGVVFAEDGTPKRMPHLVEFRDTFKALPESWMKDAVDPNRQQD